VKERAESTRRRLLEAAESVIGEKGFFRSSIADITQKAGVAQGTFYIYFKSKEEIFRELVRTMSHDLRRALQEAVAPIEDRREAEQIGFETFLRFASKRRNLYAIIRESEFVDPEIHRWYYQRLAEGYIRGIRQGIARGQVRALDPEVVAYALMGAFQFVGMRWVLWSDDPPSPAVIDSFVSLMLDGLNPSGGVAREGGDPEGKDADGLND
jgi:AcrR family transcriptional regulator